jgi:glycosyltransferase involved in cell wall biosynthesis
MPGDRGAIFVLPTTTSGQLGPVAGWISTSGWAAAAERVLGAAWVATRHGVLTVPEVRRRAAEPDRALVRGDRRARRALPPLLKTAAKDVREAVRARRFHVDPAGPWVESGRALAFVWQRHELFHTAGVDLAVALDVPSVVFVPATVVWQADQWGVRRPGWGRFLERRAELPTLRRATLVACGTDLVAEQVVRLGVDEARVIVTPTGVDPEVFGRVGDRAAARRAFGIGEELVVGWVGSFRGFHALDQLVRAIASVDGASLLLVGDGPERPGIERLATELGARVRFTGLVPHDELPGVLAAMDLGVVLSRPKVPFHYSPLKLAEYLAAGLPVVAPAVPEISGRLRRGVDAELFEAGDVAGLAALLCALRDDDGRRHRLAEGARATAGSWSWDHQVQRVIDALEGARR